MGHVYGARKTRVCPGPEARESPESTGPSVNPYRRRRWRSGGHRAARAPVLVAGVLWVLTREHFGTGISGVQPITEGAEPRSRWKRWVGS